MTWTWDGFDADQVEEPTVTSGPLPAGNYPVIITGAKMKDTKAKDGSYLEVELTVSEGPGERRKLWPKFNLDNKSEKAVQIARAELASLCRAIGLTKPTAPEDLIDAPLVVKVIVKGEQNEVKGYMAQGVAAPATKAKAAPTPKEEAKLPPWKRK